MRPARCLRTLRPAGRVSDGRRFHPAGLPPARADASGNRARAGGRPVGERRVADALGLAPQRHRVSGPYAQLRVRDPETGTWYAAERQRIRERRQDKTRLAAQDAQMVRLKRQLGLDASGGDERAEA